MSNRTTITFRVRDKGGPSGGKTVTHDAPAFDLESFMKTPNAEEFIKKAYIASVKKIVREIEEKKNGSVTSDLDSTESVIARSLAFTKDDISEWIKTRDWERASQVKDMTKLLPHLEKHLPTLASRRNPFSPEDAAKLADKVIASVADNPDAIADFLFTTLTTSRTSSDDDLLSTL
jgi:hypothetical protein